PQTAIRHSRRALGVAVGVADVRREPDGASELVTQALLGASAVPLEEAANGWTRVRLVDYEGWARKEALAAPARATERVAVVAATRAPLYTTARGAEELGEVFATTSLPITAAGQRPATGRTHVALPGGRVAWVESDAVVERPSGEPFPLRGAEAGVALARRLLGVPYLWGGVTARGIDCSGLTQLACREGGRIIPRDADQQYAALSYIVERADVRFGDLVYFASSGAITHVGIALDNMTLLHASGGGEGVVITSLDPADDERSARRAGMYAGARRPFDALDGQR
ncbi:MAG TPA: NlpC/P60 family protein, partial [Ktedonobacterales bacterium]